MFQGFLFVILAAFVAFGVTLFMATSALDERARSAERVPEATAAGNLDPVAPVASKPSKGAKPGTPRRPASSKKPGTPSGNAPVETSAPKVPPPLEPRRLF